MGVGLPARCGAYFLLSFPRSTQLMLCLSLSQIRKILKKKFFLCLHGILIIEVTHSKRSILTIFNLFPKREDPGGGGLGHAMDIRIEEEDLPEESNVYR